MPTEERTSSEGEQVPFDDMLRAGAKEEANYNRENADYINFNPNIDSIAHKEKEEQDKRDRDMEDGMLGS